LNRVYIKTYGCQMNERDSEAVASLLRARGYAIVEEDQADIILLNTCAVRDLAEQKAIGKAAHLNKRKRRQPKLVVGILGCMAQNRGADLLDRLPDLDLLIGTQKFHRVPDHLDNLLATFRGEGPRPATVVDLDAEVGSQNEIRGHDNPGGEPQVSAYVSIMQGCNMHCTFCIVPKTRGEERSRPRPRNSSPMARARSPSSVKSSPAMAVANSQWWTAKRPSCNSSKSSTPCRNCTASALLRRIPPASKPI
jgi:tRNA-2-methylthio-N6-dimethylallyladenosine synthase